MKQRSGMAEEEKEPKVQSKQNMFQNLLYDETKLIIVLDSIESTTMWRSTTSESSAKNTFPFSSRTSKTTNPTWKKSSPTMFLSLSPSSHSQEEEKNYYTYKISQDELSVAIRREFIDFNGLTDYPSLHNIIKRLKPSDVICWHGSPAQRDFLRSHLQQDDSYAVMLANNGETVEIQSHNSIVDMQLDDSLLASLSRQKIGEYEIAFLFFHSLDVAACVESWKKSRNPSRSDTNTN